ERLVTVSVDRVRSVSRTDAGTSRWTATCRGEAASAASTVHATRTSSAQPTTTSGTGSSTTGSTPTAVSTTARQVIVIVLAPCGSARHRHGGQDHVEHALGGDALELGLGAQLHSVPQRRVGERLDVVRGDVTPPGQPRPRP